MQQQPVPLIGAKRAGFRYNRRDIQFDERFEAVSANDARVLIQAKLARPAPPDTTSPARAATATAGDDRSRIVTRDAGIPTTPRAMAEKLDRELAPGAPPIPEPEPVVLEGRGGVEVDVPALRADPTELEAPPPTAKKKRVRSKRKATVGDPPSTP